MGELLSALLDISKLDAGVVVPRITTVETRALFQKLEQEFALQAQDKGIELHVVPVDRIISTDPSLLERILRNLLSNALRHTPQGRILLGARRRGTRLRLEVWDNGIGIEPHQREKIFQEFYQVGNPERDRHQGLGLGLAIVDRLSRLLGHQVEVRSTPGAGSVFSIEVPMLEAEVQPTPPQPLAEVQPGDLSGKLVVLIDDDAQVLQGTEMMLKAWGCQVVSAETIGAVLTKIDSAPQPPDLILADFRLRGEETGLMAIELINQFTARLTPAIIITGDTDPQRIREASQSGYALLHKPVRVDKLRHLIEAQLDIRIDASR
jgi:CheY-like chemotaxis protein